MAIAPVTRLQSGSVKITVWQNEGKKGPYRSVRVERGYKDPGTGEWKNSNSFFASEVPSLIQLLQKAQETLGPASRNGSGPQHIAAVLGIRPGMEREFTEEGGEE